MRIAGCDASMLQAKNRLLLPAQVAESGLGYTLSGKLLDPHSSAARSYGLSAQIFESTHTPC